LGDLGIIKRIILKIILNNQDVILWTGLGCHIMGSSGG